MESNGKHVTLDGTAGQLRYRTHLLGRAGDQRPAFFLSAHPSGNSADPLRLHRIRTDAQPARPPSRYSAGECLRADRGASVRQRPRSKSKPRARRIRWCRIAFLKATVRRIRFCRPAHAGESRQAGGALRAQRVHPRRDLEHQFVRSVGRRARQGAGAADHTGDREPRPSRRSRTTAPRTT